MAAIWFFIASAAAGSASAKDFSWDWSQAQKWHVQSEVHLPLLMWFVAPNNLEARAKAFDVQVIAACEPGEKTKLRRVRVTCEMESVSLRIAGINGIMS